MAASTVKVAPKKTGTVKLAAKPVVKKAAAAVAKPAAKAVSKLSNGTVKSAVGSAAKKAESAVKKAGTAVQKAAPVAKKAEAAVQKAGTVAKKAGTAVQKAGTQVIGTRPTKKVSLQTSVLRLWACLFCKGCVGSGGLPSGKELALAGGVFVTCCIGDHHSFCVQAVALHKCLAPRVLLCCADRVDCTFLA